MTGSKELACVLLASSSLVFLISHICVTAMPIPSCLVGCFCWRQEESKSKEDTKEQKASEKSRRRERLQSMSVEEKAAEKQRKEDDKALKLNRKCLEADALVKRLCARFTLACVERPVVLTAIDVEAWEQDNQKVTEIGVAIVKFPIASVASGDSIATNVTDTKDLVTKDCFRHRHILIREHLELRNGRHVEDNKDNFMFGDSEVLCIDDAVSELAFELNAADFIVGHAISGDLAWLRKIGVNGLEANSKALQSRVVDTQTLAYAGGGISTECMPQLGLRAISSKYALDPQLLHNGANDAAFTLQVMLSQCGQKFSAPVRSHSQHKLSAAYQAAWVEALARLNTEEREGIMREHDLQTEVEAFARLITMSCNESIDEPGDSNLENKVPSNILRFPAELTAKERKIVHTAAENLGLQSQSENSQDGKRFVTICAPGAVPGFETSNKPPLGKKTKMTKKQRKNAARQGQDTENPNRCGNQGVQRRDGDWDCRCGALVFARKGSCFKCGAVKDDQNSSKL